MAQSKEEKNVCIDTSVSVYLLCDDSPGPYHVNSLCFQMITIHLFHFVHTFCVDYTPAIIEIVFVEIRSHLNDSDTEYSYRNDSNRFFKIFDALTTVQTMLNWNFACLASQVSFAPTPDRTEKHEIAHGIEPMVDINVVAEFELHLGRWRYTDAVSIAIRVEFGFT